MVSWVSWPARWSSRSREACGAASASRDDHADRIETVVVRIVQGEGRRRRFAERGAPRPVVCGEPIAQARTPVSLEDDALDVVACGVRQGRPALQHVGPEPLHGEPGRADRRERALAPLLERELTALVAAPFHLGLAQAALEGGIPGKERTVQELRLLHDDPATGANDAGELAECPARVLDVMEDVAAPDPVEARVGRVELRGVALAKLEPPGERPAADERAGRVHTLRRGLDADDPPLRSDRLGEPEGEQPHPAPDVEAAGAVGQREVGDDRTRLRLLEQVHALERLREGLRLGLGHQRSPGVLAAASASKVYLASVRAANAVGQRCSSTIRRNSSRTRAKWVSWPPSPARVTSYTPGLASTRPTPGSSACQAAIASRSARSTAAVSPRGSTNTRRR